MVATGSGAGFSTGPSPNQSGRCQRMPKSRRGSSSASTGPFTPPIPGGSARSLDLPSRRSSGRSLDRSPTGKRPNASPALPGGDARGTKWEELYERFLPGWRELNSVTRNDAEDGFRRKVNKYLQSHRRLRNRR
jgi:hypothetical protein